MGKSNLSLSSRDYRLKDLKERLTEDGIIIIREFLESGAMDAEGLARYLKDVSPWFAAKCEEQARSFPINLAKTMVKTYCNIQRINN